MPPRVRPLPRRALIACGTACLALAFALPTTVLGIDTIGLWFDAAYSINDDQGTTFPYVGEAYLVLREPSGPSVGGWECRVGTDGPATWLGWTLEGQAANFDTPPSFTVGLGAPLPGAVDYLLATGQFMVTEAGPVAFSLLPTMHPSIPERMAYILFEDPKPLVPLDTSTGWPEVAWYNREMPVCNPSTDTLNFGEQPVGSEATSTMTVRNDGGGSLYLDAELEAGCEGFRIVAGGDPAAVAPGASHSITVGFTPTALAGFACALALGTDCDPVQLTGSGRVPVVSGFVVPNPLDFGTVTETVTAQRSISVVNSGEVPLGINVQPQPGCTAFAITGPQAFTLDPGTQANLVVEFTPPVPGTFACSVAFNEAIPPLAITGTGREANLAWDVSPPSVDFGTLGLDGGEVARTVVVGNIGDLPQALELGLVDPDGLFRIVSPLDPAPIVAPGGHLSVIVACNPVQSGFHAGTLVLGGGAPDVPLTVTVDQPSPGCSVSLTLLDFGTVNIGAHASRSVRVNNIGNTVLTVTPATSCSEFTATSGPLTIAPGRYASVIVNYRPTDVGVDQCILDLGPDACSDVVLLGEGRSAWGDGMNLVAVSFDPVFIEPEVQIPVVAPFEAYIMFGNAAHTDGVFAWELRLAYDPNVFLLGTVLRGAESINFLTPPEFAVGLASPLPYDDIIVLAQLTLMVLDQEAHSISALPTTVPSIPGEMAWAYNDNYDLEPMFPITGAPVVAWINYGGGVSVLAPMPAATVDGTRVELRWPLPSDGNGGCHVYRSVAGRETRLTADPLRPVGDGYVFSDDTRGLPGGATAAYCYAVLRDGVEIARSPAVEVELPGPDALATRLLPNRPNPFNPETEIPFTLERAGHARIAVYDLSGRRIAVLLDDTRPVGADQVVWRGRDDHGRLVPSGSYYVILETATARDARKVMLLK